MMMLEETTHNGESVLSFLEAAAKGNVEKVMRSLHINPGLINTPHPETGSTALIAAAEENHSEVITLLLEHGADVTACNSANQTAVHVADDGVQAQLLSAVTRTSYPQLSMLQAAWQGDLGSVRHLLSTDPGQSVHTRNGQGLTPAMLVLRDVDLFVGVTMRHDYRPVEVLQELLTHNADADLLDSGGRSAFSYVSEVKNPLRRQLMDALERCAPPPDAHGEASCDLGIKPPLHDAPPAGVIQKEDFEELSRDGISSDYWKENLEPAAGLGEQPDLRGEVTFQEMENFDQMQERKGNPFSRQWFTDPTPEHLTSQSAIKRHPSLPPLHMKSGEGVSSLERLGLGYLVQESYSEPNILECHSTPNAFRDLKYIKGHIRHRLGSTESSRDSKTFPPISHLPRSLMPARLKPLSKISSRNKETNRSSMALSSDNLDNSGGEGLPYEQNLQKSLQSLKDIVFSREPVQINLDTCFCSKKLQSPRDDCSSKTGEDRSKSGMEDTEERDTAKIHISCRDIKPLLHQDRRQKNYMQSEASIHIEQLQFYEHGESFRESHLSEMKEKDLLELEIHEENKGNEENVGAAEDTKTKVEPNGMDNPRTPRYVPFVHITLSEQEPVRDTNYSPSKALFTKRKTKPASLLCNVNHSFNILAQKENVKTSKNRKTRNMSASDNTKQQRPLSNSNRTHGKSVPLPTLPYSSVPSPSKVPKKVSSSAQGSTDKSGQRSHTQLSLYSKRMKSPSNIPILSRSKSSHDFQDIKYSDMFVEITSQQSTGPAMYQMFPPTVYVNNSTTYRETSSAPTTRNCSSKGSRGGSSRDSSAKSKRPKLKNKKTPSATSRRRRNSSSKQVSIEEGQNKMENTVIISGVDWEIKTQKHGGDNAKFPLNGMMDAKHQNFALTTIKEASIENSMSIRGNFKETLKTLIELERSVTVRPNNPENVDHDLLKEVIECVQRDTGLSNSSCHKDTYNDQVLRGVPPPSQTPSQLQDKALADWVLSHSYEKGHSVELRNDEEDVYFTSRNEGSHSPAFSEHLTAQLISCLENLIMTDEESSEDGEDGEDTNVHECPQPSNIQQVGANPSLTEYTSHPSADESVLLIQEHDESAFYWIKGEVLGKGAYGTVYRGLTSQGELIAAKQVILHGSDAEVAEKEYKKLQEEVELLKALAHPNIVGYLGTSFEDPVVTIFMEFVPGGSISSNIRQFGPLKEAVISKYTSHILQGTSYLHKNRVVHRDIKGTNVMLMPNGVIKLIDFGCAKRLSGLSINGTHGEMLLSVRGTPYWMAPEVINESGHGEKSDIWSIGCTVYEMATGKPPLAHMDKWAAMFYIGAEKGLMPTLPDHFSKNAREIVNLCFIRDQDKRPSAEQLLQHPFVRSTS